MVAIGKSSNLKAEFSPRREEGGDHSMLETQIPDVAAPQSL